MEGSLWGQAGALVGGALGYLNYRVIMSILEPRLRALEKSESAEERGAFERKITLLRRTFLALEVVILGGMGYWIGAWFGE